MSKPTQDGETDSKKDTYRGKDTKWVASDYIVRLDNPLNQFVEYSEVCSLISSLPQVCGDQISREASQERLLGKTNMAVAIIPNFQICPAIRTQLSNYFYCHSDIGQIPGTTPAA